MTPDKPHQRLRLARETAGYKAASAFAAAHGIPQPTYALHESGKRALLRDVAQTYAEALDTTAAWLLHGVGEPPSPQVVLPSPTYRIAEMDVRASAGSGSSIDNLTGTTEDVAVWQVPADFIRGQTTAPANQVKIIRVYGDSMAPSFNPGDRVLVDVSDVNPSPPGVFVLWDGLGIVMKRLEFLPYSDPKAVRLLSDNPAYSAYERPLADIKINGRVIAKWLWT